MKTEYDIQAEKFLRDNGLKLRITLSDSKAAPWEVAGHHYRVTLSRSLGDLEPVRSRKNEIAPKRVVFDFWGSTHDAKEVKTPSYREDHKTGQYVPTLDGKDISPTSFDRERAIQIAIDASFRHPSAYDVLACIASDIHTPESFEEFCSEYGYESDSIKALQTFRRADRFAKRLRAFFTDSEAEQLSEIQ